MALKEDILRQVIQVVHLHRLLVPEGKGVATARHPPLQDKSLASLRRLLLASLTGQGHTGNLHLMYPRMGRHHSVWRRMSNNRLLARLRRCFLRLLLRCRRNRR